jgi:hypothetical protein
MAFFSLPSNCRLSGETQFFSKNHKNALHKLEVAYLHGLRAPLADALGGSARARGSLEHGSAAYFPRLFGDSSEVSPQILPGSGRDLSFEQLRTTSDSIRRSLREIQLRLLLSE